MPISSWFNENISLFTKGKILTSNEGRGPIAVGVYLEIKQQKYVFNLVHKQNRAEDTLIELK